MILNEDFFNDVKIKDEDLTAEIPNLTHKEYNVKTSRELIEHEISESEMVLMINIYKFSEECDTWHKIERIMKRLKYMFDIYNISISEPFITYSGISFKILKDKKFPDDYTIIQHKGCDLYFEESILRKYRPDKVIMKDDLNLFVFLDKKLPVFKTARSAYNFVISLDKCLWKDVINPKDECFSWYGLYNIDDIYYGNELICSYSSSNSYVNNDGNWIYKSV